MSGGSDAHKFHDIEQESNIDEELFLYENAVMLSEKLELKFKMMKMHDVWLLKKALAVIFPNKRGVL